MSTTTRKLVKTWKRAWQSCRSPNAFSTEVSFHVPIPMRQFLPPHESKGECLTAVPAQLAWMNPHRLYAQSYQLWHKLWSLLHRPAFCQRSRKIQRTSLLVWVLFLTPQRAQHTAICVQTVTATMLKRQSYRLGFLVYTCSRETQDQHNTQLNSST